MNSVLLEKYEEEWEALEKSLSTTIFGADMPTNPLLLDVPIEYFSADYKVIIFGQETNDWEGPFPHPMKMNHLLENYREFYNEGYCFSYGGQFWNGVSKLKESLTEKLEQPGKTQSFVWNNVIKIGKVSGKGTPDSQMLKWQDAWFDVVLFEMLFLNPDIVVFFTGPNYDRFISQIFGDASFERLSGRDSRQLARVQSRFLPQNTIRTYHPGYLWRIGFYDFLDEIMDAVEC